MDNSPFIRLPAEVRNDIYSLVIGPRPYKKLINIGKACQVEIARVCKQMRRECLPMCFANITARANVVSNFELPFNHKHETASLDRHWGSCRASFCKGVSNIMAVAQRISMHPQVCYDGLRRLNLRIILDAEDYGFELAWQVWEPHLQNLARVVEQRELGERLCVRVEFHTFSMEEKTTASEDLKTAFETLGLRLDEVKCLWDRDLQSEMEKLRKQWRNMLAREAAGNEEMSRCVKFPQVTPSPYFDNGLYTDDMRPSLGFRALDVRKLAKARGEAIADLEDEQPGYIGPGWTFCGGGGNLVPGLWLRSDMVRPLLERYRKKMLAALEEAGGETSEEDFGEDDKEDHEQDDEKEDEVVDEKVEEA